MGADPLVLNREKWWFPARAASVKGVVLHGAGRCFCAGADISAFGAAQVGLIRPHSAHCHFVPPLIHFIPDSLTY